MVLAGTLSLVVQIVIKGESAKKMQMLLKLWKTKQQKKTTML